MKLLRVSIAALLGSLLWAGCASFERMSVTRDLNDRTLTTNFFKITVPLVPLTKRTTYFISPEFVVYSTRETDAKAVEAIASGVVKGAKGF